MLLVYYNPNHNCFYSIFKNFTYEKVGDINGFNHVLVQIFYISNGKFYNINDFTDIDLLPKSNIKKRFIKRLIRFLNKM